MGFALLAEKCLKENIDVPIYVAYYKIKENTYIFGESILYSKLKETFANREEISKYLVDKCNELGKLDTSKYS